MTAGLYARAPLRMHGEIPVFSAADGYTENYASISADHLAELERTAENPWIPEELWRESEASTLALIQRHSRPGDRILDVGVGLGRLLGYVPDRRRYGMDISLGYLERAAAAGIEVCFARIEDMPYHADSFDIVVCTDVLEHVLDLHLCCSRILSVLRPGGTLIVRVPNRQDLSEYLDPAYPYEFVHLRNFDAPSLQLLFGKIFGCEVLETAPGAYWPFNDRLRWVLPLPRFRGLMRHAMLGLSRVSRGAFTALLPRLYHPEAVNIAVRKPAA
jgi:SAM-dependent methyltransferase